MNAKKLVGVDASGLELRVFAHYLYRFDKGRYVNEILSGDIHTANQKAAGLESRDQAKVFIYTTLYGGGDEKIGEVAQGKQEWSRGRRIKEGKILSSNFRKNVPAYAKLKDAVTKKVKEKGYLVGLDGRILNVRSEHSALNLLFQSAGAIVMKRALVILYNKLEKKYTFGKEYAFVANIHDEFQIECDADIAEEVAQEGMDAIRLAGEYYNMKCPLDGEANIGNNWKETH